MEKLIKLIDSYYENKSMQDTYKKICDAENKEIKEIMSSENLPEFSTNKCTAKYYVQTRTSFDEVKALEIIKRAGITACVKTVEVLDVDKLEAMLYNKEVSAEVMDELAKCNSVKEVPSLKVTLRK